VKSFSERSPQRVALAGIVVGALALAFALNFNRLIHSGTTYHADLANAAGLVTGDVVRVSGVDVGELTGIKLHGDRVRISFTVRSNVALPDQTHADVGVLSPLGTEYLALDPAGSGRLAAGAVIPLSRTSVPFTLVGAFEKAGSLASHVDLGTVTKALRAVNRATAERAPTHAALTGLAQLSTTIAKHQAQLATLLRYGDRVTSLLDTRRAALVNIMGQGDEVLQVLATRRAAIAQLLTAVRRLDHQVSSLLTKNRATLGPLLHDLDTITGVLDKNGDALGKAIPLLAAFDRYAANATGSGPFVDLYAPTLLIPDNIVKQCSAPSTRTSNGCRP
jgi:phospholipid/cholesterol/gamma-HCH transport system substrate-binding protein